MCRMGAPTPAFGDAAQRDLVATVLALHFGDACAMIGSLLVRQAGGLTLREIEARLGSAVRHPLVVLLLHGCVLYEERRYKVKSHEVLERLRYPRMLRCVEKHLGAAAEAVLAQLMRLGPTKQRLLCSGDSAASRKASGVALIRAGYMCPVDDSRTPSLALHSACNGSSGGVHDEKQQQQFIDEDTERVDHVGRRISRWEGEPETMWCCSLAPLRSRMLREMCESVVGRKLSREMRDVVSTMFSVGAWRYQHVGGRLKDTGVTASTLFEALPTGTLRSLSHLRQYLESLRFDTAKFVESLDVDVFVFDAYSTLDYARRQALHGALVERYDLAAARLIALLCRHHKLDQAELAERGLLPPKDARARLYSMFSDGLIDLHQNANAPQDPVWVLDLDRAYRSCLADARSAIRNLLIRRHFEVATSRLSHNDGQADDWTDDRAAKVPAIDRIDHALIKLDAFAHVFEASPLLQDDNDAHDGLSHCGALPCRTSPSDS